MKHIRAWMLAIVATLAFVNVGCYRTVLQPTHSIQPGEIIKNSDLQGSKVGPLFSTGEFIADREQIVGHRALATLYGGTRIHRSLIDPNIAPEAKTTPNLWAPADPNDKSVIKEIP